MKHQLKSLIAAGLLSTTSASHGAVGPYFSISAGQATYDTALEDYTFIDDGSIVSATLDDSDTSFNFALGYQLTPNVAIEGGFLDLGEFVLNSISDGSVFYTPGPVDLVVAVDGLFVNLKARIPLSQQVNLFGKLGVLKYDVEVTFSDSTASASGSDDDTDTFIGGGLSFNINDSTAFNIDYTRYSLDDIDVDVISAGLQFGF